MSVGGEGLSDSAAKPTPSQLTMLLGWEKELEHDEGDPTAEPSPGNASPGAAEPTPGAAEPIPGAAEATPGEAPAAPTEGATRPPLKLRDWVSYTLGVALMALREEGSVGMEYVERRKLWIFPSRHVMLTKLGPTSFPTSSFEAELWAKLGDRPTPTLKLVRGWFGGAVENPWGKVVGRIQTNLTEAGLVSRGQEDAHRGKVTGRLFGKTKTVFHTDAHARELLAQVEALHTSLTQPDETGDDLRDKVFKEVGKAIASKKVSDAGG